MSCAHWLAWQCGLSPGAAREHVRVARALQSLPLIEAAFAAGAALLLEGPRPDADRRARHRGIPARAGARADRLPGRAHGPAMAPGRPARRRRAAGRAAPGVRLLVGRRRHAHGQACGWPPRPAPRSSPRSSRSRNGPRAASAPRRRRPAVALDVSPPLPTNGRRRLPEPRSPGNARTARRIAALSRLAEAAADADRRAGDPPRREVVVHVDAAVLADDAAAGRAYLEGGPALTRPRPGGCSARRPSWSCWRRAASRSRSAARKRRATKAQRRALLHRDGGCARPGCPETRIERLHAHHMRHWLFGGRTDLTNLVLLCDRDHGLVHDLELVMSRRQGDARSSRLPTGAGSGARRTPPSPTGWPDSTARTRQPRGHRRSDRLRRRPSDRRHGRPPPARSGAPIGPVRPAREPPPDRSGSARGLLRRPHGTPTPSVGATLFPGGEPPLPDWVQVNGERMDIRYVVGVLMGNRDLIRRLAAEQGVPAGT